MTPRPATLCSTNGWLATRVSGHWLLHRFFRRLRILPNALGPFYESAREDTA